MILDRIVQATKARLEREKKERSAQDLLRAVTREPLPFLDAFTDPEINVIAEVKRSSPALGVINLSLDPCAVAKNYLENGAKALSVLTEPDFFKGSTQHLAKIRGENPTARLLMKDFFIDEYQLLSAKASGADAILLIVRLMDRRRLRDMLQATRDLGLSALVEVHETAEMETALSCEAPLIGINNRNLDSLEIKVETSFQLAPLVPSGTTLISESGIETAGEIRRLTAAGFRGFLVGTAFMRSENPGHALAKLLEESRCE